MRHLYDKLIAFAILGIFLGTTAMTIHNLMEIHSSLSRAKELLSDQPEGLLESPNHNDILKEFF